MQAQDTHVTTETRRSKQGRRWLEHLKRLSLVIILLVAIGEAASRAIFYEQLKMQSRPLFYEDDADIGYRYAAGASGTIRVPSIDKVISTNSRGYFGPDFERRKPPGFCRVIIVGSSNETGTWMDGERAFSEILQQRFDAKSLDVEVINCAIDGSNRGLSMLRQIESEIVLYEPDLVLLRAPLPIQSAVFYRSTYEGYIYYRGTSKMSAKRIARRVEAARRLVEAISQLRTRWLYDVSFLFRGFCRWWGRDPDNTTAFLLNMYQQKRIFISYPKSYFTIVDSILELARIRELLMSRGSELMLFSYDTDPECRDLLEAAEIPFACLDMPQGSWLRNEHDGHYNQEGHRIIADRLWGVLSRQLPCQ